MEPTAVSGKLDSWTGGKTNNGFIVRDYNRTRVFLRKSAIVKGNPAKLSKGAPCTFNVKPSEGKGKLPVALNVVFDVESNEGADAADLAHTIAEAAKALQTSFQQKELQFKAREADIAARKAAAEKDIKARIMDVKKAAALIAAKAKQEAAKQAASAEALVEEAKAEAERIRRDMKDNEHREALRMDELKKKCQISNEAELESAKKEAQKIRSEAEKIRSEAIKEVAKEKAAWEEEKKRIAQSHTFKEDVVCLDFGGICHKTRRSTLTERLAKDTWFASLLSGRHEVDEKEIFVDRDGRVAHILINFFRNPSNFKEVSIPTDPELLHLLREDCQYYCMPTKFVDLVNYSKIDDLLPKKTFKSDTYSNSLECDPGVLSFLRLSRKPQKKKSTRTANGDLQLSQSDDFLTSFSEKHADVVITHAKIVVTVTSLSRQFNRAPINSSPSEEKEEECLLVLTGIPPAPASGPVQSEIQLVKCLAKPNKPFESKSFERQSEYGGAYWTFQPRRLSVSTSTFSIELVIPSKANSIAVQNASFNVTICTKGSTSGVQIEEIEYFGQVKARRER